MAKNRSALTSNAQRLRRQGTPQEQHLWYDFLNQQSTRFRRQFVVEPYILDFYCASRKLAIELDGSQHYEDAALAYDERRSQFLAEKGITVMRFSNYDVDHNFDAVCETIYNRIHAGAEDEGRGGSGVNQG